MQLEEFNISDAVVFNDQLNPAIWRGNQLRPEVKAALMEIARDFQTFIGVDNFDLRDITISGSNAAYTYTPNSDIDLHLVVMIPSEHDAELRELFDAKKYQYNNLHDFQIRGYDVELYVQDAEQAHHSMGIYSVQDDRWLSEPRRERAHINDDSVRNKYDTLKQRISKALESDDIYTCRKIWNSIKDMRKAGLEAAGEFSPENLVFKLLRAEGDLEELRKHILKLTDRRFSI